MQILSGDAKDLADRTGLQFHLNHVCVRDLNKLRDVQLPEGSLHCDVARAIDDPEVSIVIELIGGIEPAKSMIIHALDAGKDVVTANKALLAEHGVELFAHARQRGRTIAFEASCAGGIPIVGALRDGLIANRIDSICGILNGTCNYILTEMSQTGMDYSAALLGAKKAGYAEADPTLDVNGTDSAHKLAILATLAFGGQVRLSAIDLQGIDSVDPIDIRYGKQLGYTMKLLALGENDKDGALLRVHPAFLPDNHPLAQVGGAFNAVSVYAHAAGPSMFYGQGAGRLPTASAIVSDLVNTALGKTRIDFQQLRIFPDTLATLPVRSIDQLCGRYYLRCSVEDEPGVMARITDAFGSRRISLSSIYQQEASEDQSFVPVVILTHQAREGDLRDAVSAIDRLDIVSKPTVSIRLLSTEM